MALTKEEFLKKMAEGRARKKLEKQTQQQPVNPPPVNQPAVNTQVAEAPVEKAPEGSVLANTIKAEERAAGKEPKRPVLPQQWQSAFSREGHTQAIDYLASPGADTENLLMRSDIPERRFGVALSEILAKAEEFGNEGAKTQVKNLTAVQVSVKAMGRNQIVQAIVGGNPDNMGHGNMGLAEKIKDWAFGKKKKPVEEE